MTFKRLPRSMTIRSDGRLYIQLSQNHATRSRRKYTCYIGEPSLDERIHYVDENVELVGTVVEFRPTGVIVDDWTIENFKFKDKLLDTIFNSTPSSTTSPYSNSSSTLSPSSISKPRRSIFSWLFKRHEKR